MNRFLLTFTASIISLTILTPVSAEPTSLMGSLNQSGNEITVQVRTKKFVKETHTIHKLKNGAYIIDSMRPIGTSALPNTEIAEFKIIWNGKPVTFPKKLYADCYDIGMEGLTTELSKDGNKAILLMRGSDGAYAYDVIWIFDKENVLDRFVIENAD